MHDVSEEVRARLSLELASDVVGFAAAEMVASKENQTDWQGAASAILVSLGVKFANPVMDALLGLFKPGNVPPYFVVKCLADLAAANRAYFSFGLSFVVVENSRFSSGIRISFARGDFSRDSGLGFDSRRAFKMGVYHRFVSFFFETAIWVQNCVWISTRTFR